MVANTSEESALRRTRTYKPLIKSRNGSACKPLPANTSEQQTSPLSAPLAQPVQTDPDLTRIVNAWANLPSAIKAGIMALVQASSPAGSMGQE